MKFKNNKAFYDYELIEQFTCGIQLLGSEVKSLRLGKCSLVGAYAIFKNNELFTKDVHIAPYDSTNKLFNHEPLRQRKLLLNKKELKDLKIGLETAGNSIIVTNIFLNDKGKFKITIMLARGKKNHDKRNTIKDKDLKKETDRIIKNNY